MDRMIGEVGEMTEAEWKELKAGTIRAALEEVVVAEPGWARLADMVDDAPCWEQLKLEHRDKGLDSFQGWAIGFRCTEDRGHSGSHRFKAETEEGMKYTIEWGQGDG